MSYQRLLSDERKPYGTIPQLARPPLLGVVTGQQQQKPVENIFQNPHGYITDNFTPEYYHTHENPQNWVQQATNTQADIGAYLNFANQAVGIANNAIGYGQFFRPPKPINPRPYQQNPNNFNSHKEIIRDYLEGTIDELPHTIRNPVHNAGKPFQPSRPHQIPNKNRWHNPNIGMPSKNDIRKALEGIKNSLKDAIRFPFHNTGKPYQPTQPTRLPNQPC